MGTSIQHQPLLKVGVASGSAAPLGVRCQPRKTRLCHKHHIPSSVEFSIGHTDRSESREAQLPLLDPLLPQGRRPPSLKEREKARPQPGAALGLGAIWPGQKDKAIATSGLRARDQADASMGKC